MAVRKKESAHLPNMALPNLSPNMDNTCQRSCLPPQCSTKDVVDGIKHPCNQFLQRQCALGIGRLEIRRENRGGIATRADEVIDREQARIDAAVLAILSQLRPNERCWDHSEFQFSIDGGQTTLKGL